MNWLSLGLSRIDVMSWREKVIEGIPGDGWSISNISEESDGGTLVVEFNWIIGYSLEISGV